MTTPPLPPGFVLDEPPPLEIDIKGGRRVSQAVPPLPEGFELETPGTPPAANNSAFARMVTGAPAPQEGGFLRDLGMSARSVIQGAGGLLGSVGDAFNHYLVPGDQPSYREAAAALADKIGLPSPQTKQERILGDIGEALTGTGLTMGAGGVASAAAKAPGALAELGSFLTAQPVLQAVSTATGAGAGSLARENGAGLGGQVAASLLGGLAPGVAAALPAMAARGAARGATPDAMLARMEQFDAAGVTPSMGQATGNRAVQALESTLGSVPGGAGRIDRFARQQADQFGGRIDQLARDLSPRGRAVTPEQAGRSVVKGIEGDDGFIQSTRARSDQLYQRLDNLIPKDQGVDVSNVRQVLSDLNAGIEGAPNTSNLFRNSRISGIQSALEKDLAIPTEAQAKLDDVLKRIDHLYASRDLASQEAGKFSAFANDQANRIEKFFPVEGQPRISGRYSPSVQRAEEGASAAAEATGIARDRVSQAQQLESTINDLRHAAEASGGKLPYEAVQKLRTLVGRELESNSLVSDVPRSKWKAVYGALTKDMESAASTPEAKQALSRANAYYASRVKRLDDISHVIEKNGGPEKVFAAATSGVKDGATTLRQVMRSLPEDSQRELSSAFLRRMGRATPGQQDAEGAVFSMDRFLTNWNAVSPEAKSTLFGRYGSGFSKDMDKIAAAADAVKSGSKVFANPSGTARKEFLIGQTAGTLATAGTAAATGNVGMAALALMGSATSAALANASARLVTNPRYVKWLSRATEMPVGSLVAQLNALRNIARDEKDPEMERAAEEMKTEASAAPAQ
ncbi:hypothetical protein [Pseudoxanthomonas winnipegensis]|uniref:hypothetical protein n=1 Tax=Pseudoxanthomonas winnipegensis TaxID=2480810 RepID=UPI00102DE510|nr:hypothetical protein [Pseudoxanthomonas winnipegensis]RZZ85691.1 hypothetical protein EA663_11830 [Pseudoxanthomonas winnipegensis]